MPDPYSSYDEPVRSSPAPFASSGKLTPLLIAAVCFIILAISYLRGKGNYHRLHDEVVRVTTKQVPVRTPHGPGGEDPVVLRREPDAVSNTPEFVSATLLPGRGMEMLQLRASVPGHGQVPLLVAPGLDQAAALLNGNGADANGALQTTFGAAFLVPWAGRATGRPNGLPGVLQASYAGTPLSFPAGSPGASTSTEGLLLNRAADATSNEVLLDGQSAQSLFHAGSFGGNWPSNSDVKVLVELSGQHLDMTVTVTNTGNAPMPAAVGWKPHFAIPSGNRRNATLVISAADRLEIDRTTGLPDGRLIPIGSGAVDYRQATGTPLGTASVNETYTHLTTPTLAQQPLVELRDQEWGFGLRIIPLTSNIRAMRVEAPADAPWVSIGPNMNAGDPFGPQWTTEHPSGMQMVKPGESIVWRVRVELFSFTRGDRLRDE